MDNNIAIKAENLSKVYKIFDRPIDRLKEALSPFHKRYSKDFYALDNISFEIKKGETVGIIGKNGAGKSTLLKIITGVLTPSSGSIQVNGRIASLLELGAGFNPEMTGIENIYMNGTVMGYSKEEMDKRLNNIVSFADIGDFINQPVKMYSSGMFARLAFAVNAFVEPDILIVDEALAVGDIFFQNKCFKKFEDLRKKGVTILFVSHDLGSIKQLSTKTLWLENGISNMFGDTQSVCASYQNEQIEEINKQTILDIKKDENNNYIDVHEQKGKYFFPKIQVKGEKILSKNVSIESVFFKDKNNKIVTELITQKEYTLSIVAKFYKAMDDIIFGFVLENKKGIQILGINSFINSNEKLIKINSPQIIKIDFRFILPKISSGDYIITSAIAQGIQKEHKVLTSLTGVLCININNIGYNLTLLEINSNVSISNYENNQVSFYEKEV